MADNESLRETFSLVQGEKPDQYAQALDLAGKVDLDVDTVKRNHEVVGQQHWLNTYDFDGLTKNTPRLATWLEHPDNAAVAQDDLEEQRKMAWLLERPEIFRPKDDESIAADVEAYLDSKLSGDLVYNSLDENGKKSVREEQRKRLLKQFKAEEAFIAGNDKVGFLETVKRSGSENPLGFVPFLGSAADAGNIMQAWKLADAVNNGTATPDQEMELERFHRLQSVAAMRGKSAGGYAGDIVYRLPSFVGEVASGAALGKAGAQAAGKVGAVNAFERSMGKAMLKLVGKRKALRASALALSKPLTGIAGVTASLPVAGLGIAATETLDRMSTDTGLVKTEDGYEVQVTGEGQSWQAAVPRAVASAWIELASESAGGAMAFMNLPSKELFKLWGRKAPGASSAYVRKLMKEAKFEGALPEFMEERVGDVMRDVASRVFGEDQQFQKFSLPSKEQALGELAGFMVPGAVMTAADQAILGDQIKQEQELLRALEQGNASKLGQRSPASQRKLVEELTKNGPIENVYLDREEFSALMQTKGVEPEVVAEQLGFGKAFREGEATGTIKIPTGAYASDVMPSEYGKDFKEILTFQQDGLTPKAYKAAVSAAKAEVEREDKVKKEEEEWVRKDIEQGLSGTMPNTTPEQVKAITQAWVEGLQAAAARESVLQGKRVGIQQFWRENPILFEQSSDANKQMSQAEQMKQLAERGILQIKLPGETSIQFLARTFKSMTPAQRVRKFATDFKTGLLGTRTRQKDIAWEAKAGMKPFSLDVEGVKYFNDSVSHTAGDALYRAVAQALAKVAPGSVKVGGDFMFFAADQADAERIIEEARQAMPERIKLGNETVNLRGLDFVITEGADARLKADAVKQERVKKELRAERGQRPLNVPKLEGESEAPGMIEGVDIPGEVEDAFNAMPADQQMMAIYFDKEHGMLNGDGFYALPEKAFKAHADLDHLGLTNKAGELFGTPEGARKAGDVILRAASRIMVQISRKPEYADIDVAHISGDEYYAQSDNADTLEAYWKEVESTLLNKILHVRLKSGKLFAKRGITLSAGIGGSHDIAESESIANKKLDWRVAEREQAHGGWFGTGSIVRDNDLSRNRGGSGIARQDGPGDRSGHQEGVGLLGLPKEHLQGGVEDSLAPVSDALESYNYGDDTVSDLADNIEAAVEDMDGPAEKALREAVEKFREEQEYDRELKGRGDMDEAEQAFVAAVEKVAKKYGSKPLNQSAAEPFYSRLIQTLETKLPNKASAEQVRGLTKDLSAEEKKWLGLDEFLGRSQSVDKATLLEFLRANMPQVQEVVKGGSTESEYKIVQNFDNYYEVVGPGTDAQDDSFRTYREAEERLMEYDRKGDTKFSEYQLPGGENYREVLFTLPVSYNEYEAFRNKMEAKYLTTNFTGKMTDAEHEEYAAVKDRASNIPTKEFLSGHWDEPNVLAHVRLNDRTDADGKRVLFVEEIQSDWHQKGRKQGYKDEEKPLVWSFNKQENIWESKAPDGSSIFLQKQGGTWTSLHEGMEVDSGLKSKEEAEKALLKYLGEQDEFKSSSLAVPDAPFRKTWHEFAFKRILRMAAEGGYDSVAWTTGAQQAERYDLSKQVSEVGARRNDDGTFGINANTDRGVVTIGEGIPANKLDEYVGKDLAKKIKDQSEEFKKYSGLDLKVGGEGMKGFYDKILVDYAGKFGKKFGAKVGETEVETKVGQAKLLGDTTFFVVDGTAISDPTKDIQHGMPLPEPIKYWTEMGVPEDVVKKALLEAQGTDALVSVHSLPITPELKAAALGEGFSLFQAAYHGTPHKFSKFTLDHIGTGEGAQAYGWGLYFASQKAVADYYRETTAGAITLKDLTIGRFVAMKGEQWQDYSSKDTSAYENARATIIEDILVDQAGLEAEFALGGEKAAKAHVLKTIDEHIQRWTDENYTDGVAGAKKFRAEVQKHGVKMKGDKPGNTYAVDIPEDSELLDYDKPLSEQPAGVRKKLEKAGFGGKVKLKLGMSLGDGWVLADGHSAGKLQPYAMVKDGKSFGLNKADVERLIGKIGGEVEGKTIYSKLEEQHGSPEAASRYLLSIGIPGLRYLDETSRNMRTGKDKSHNYVIWDEASIKMLQELEQAESNKATPMARILQARQGGKAIMTFFQSANVSSGLHEFGHYLLNTMAGQAAHPNAPQALLDDTATIAKHLGLPDLTNIPDEAHEKFVNTFLKYLENGQAPSEGLRKVFAKFRVWLLSVWREIRIWSDIEVTPEMRGVFDRMLASEEAIDSNLRESGLIDDIPMPGPRNEEYRQAVEAAKERAQSILTAKAVAEFNREKLDWWKSEEDRIREEVKKEVAKDRIYEVVSILTTGKKLDGSDVSAVGKIDPASVPKGMHRELPKGVLADEGGVPIEVMAEMLRYDNAGHLLRSLREAKMRPFEKAVDIVTEAKMAELYPELLSAERLEPEALEAIHNDTKTKALELALEILWEQRPAVVKQAIKDVARRPPSAATTKAKARAIVSSMTMESLNPQAFLRQESRAAKEAGVLLAKGDILGAYDAKTRELLAHESYKAAIEARNNLEYLEKVIAKKMFQSDEKLSKSRDLNIVQVGREVLQAFGLGKQNDSGSWLNAIKAYDPAAYSTLTAMVKNFAGEAVPYKQATVEQINQLHADMKILWKLTRDTNQITLRGQVEDKDAIVAELVPQIPARSDPRYTHYETKWDKFLDGILDIRAALRRMEHWTEAMGPTFKRILFRPVSEAVTQYKLAARAVSEKHLALVKAHGQVEPGEITSQDLGWTFKNKAEVIGALMHTGNASNLQKLLVGRGWGDLDEEGNLDTTRWDAFLADMHRKGILVKADWEYVQGVWDLLEELKPLAQKAHRSLYGFYFSEVTANEVATPFGNYRGGYFPAVVDKSHPMANKDVIKKAEEEVFQSTQQSFLFPTTGKGFTKKRVDAYAGPLDLDPRMVSLHIDKVLRFAYIQPTVSEVYRLVQDRTLGGALKAHDKAVMNNLIVPFLQRAASQRVSEPGAFDGLWRNLRGLSSMNAMVGNVMNTIQQFTGFSISAVKVKPGLLGSALMEYISHPTKTAEMVRGKSDFMKTRTSTQAAEVQQQIAVLLEKPQGLETVRDFTEKNGYAIQEYTQGIVDMATWLGAYNQAVREGQDEKEAVAHADSMVRLTQGSFNPEDASRVETLNSFSRLFTMFYSYFNMQANLLGTEFHVALRDMGFKNATQRSLYVYVAGLLIPAALSEVLYSSVTPDDDDESIVTALLGGQAQSIAAMVPGGNALMGAAIGAWTDQRWDDDMRVSPVFESVQSVLRAPAEVVEDVQKGDVRKKTVKDVLTAMSYALRLPLGWLGRPLGYLADDKNEDAMGTARGLITGR